MSGVSDWSEAEKELYAVGTRAILDDLERQRREWNESYALDSTSMDEINRAHSERMRELEEQHKAWLARLLKDASGAADEPAPPQDVGQGHGASATGPAPAPGPGPGQPDPQAAELTEADIKAMSLDEFSAFRARIGIGNASGRGLFG